MGREHDLHGLVDVPPFRMVVALLGNQRHAGHEAERFIEVLEDEGATNRITSGRLRPAIERRERLLARLAGQLFSHCSAPFSFKYEARGEPLSRRWVPSLTMSGRDAYSSTAKLLQCAYIHRIGDEIELAATDGAYL